jgi:cytochrome c556
MRRMGLTASGLVLGVALASGAGVGAGQAPDLELIDKTMKEIGPAFTTLRKAVDGRAMADAKANAEALSKAFVETESFFKSHDQADGVEWAQTAKKAADAIAAASSGDAAKAPVGALTKTCAGCHAKYRERAADGSYNYKPGI